MRLMQADLPTLRRNVGEFRDFLVNVFAPIGKENLKASYTLGLVGETAELKKEVGEYFRKSGFGVSANTVAEAGDVAHYIVGLCHLYEIYVPDILLLAMLDASNTANSGVHMTVLCSSMVDTAASIGDMVKKNLFHGKKTEDIIEPLKGRLVQITALLISVVSMHDLTFEDLLDNNREKLVKRFGGEKFNGAYVNQPQGV